MASDVANNVLLTTNTTLAGTRDGEGAIVAAAVVASGLLIVCAVVLMRANDEHAWEKVRASSARTG